MFKVTKDLKTNAVHTWFVLEFCGVEINRYSRSHKHEAYNQARKLNALLNGKQSNKCPDCKGFGWIKIHAPANYKDCENCDGMGVLSTTPKPKLKKVIFADEVFMFDDYEPSESIW